MAVSQIATHIRIKVTSIYVDDQEKALRFYTDVLGFVKKTDVTQGPYRWLTVASPEEPDGADCNWCRMTTRQPRPISRPCSSRASPPPCSTWTTSSGNTTG